MRGIAKRLGILLAGIAGFALVLGPTSATAATPTPQPESEVLMAAESGNVDPAKQCTIKGLGEPTGGVKCDTGVYRAKVECSDGSLLYGPGKANGEWSLTTCEPPQAVTAVSVQFV